MAGRLQQRDAAYRSPLSSQGVGLSDAMTQQQQQQHSSQYQQEIHPSRQSLHQGNYTHFTVRGGRPDTFINTRIPIKTGLPDSEPIYHDIEEERQRSLSLKRQRPAEQAPAGKSMSPARQRVTAIAATVTPPIGNIKPFRPLPELHLPPEETESDHSEVQRVPSDVQDTWVVYGDAIESGSVLTGWSRQELLRRQSRHQNEEVKKRKEKKYGKKKKKSLILNLPIPFSNKRGDDWPKYSRGAEEFSSTASVRTPKPGSRKAQLTERWARKGIKRFSIPLHESHPDNSQQHEKILTLGSRSSEDLTSAMSSQSPHVLHIAEHDASMTDDYGFGSPISKQLVKEWLGADSIQRPVDRSTQSDDASFPYLSAPTPPPPPRPPSRSPPSHLDSSVSHSIAAASDQAVADSTASFDDLRLKALEITVSFDVLENENSGNVGMDNNAIHNKEEERNQRANPGILETETGVGGNDSPTSIVDIQLGMHSADVLTTPTQPPQPYNPSPPPPSTRNSSAPKSILRRRTLRPQLSDCPSDEGGSADENDFAYHLPKQKTVRISFERDEENVSKSPPRDGSFRDDEGQELSPIRPEKPALPTLDIPCERGNELQDIYSTPHNWPSDGWRESDPTVPNLAQVREVDEFSEGESEGYSLGFIEEVAAVVIQTAVRQLLAKLRVLAMLEDSLSYMREPYFSDMTFRMFNLAAIKIQSAFRGWWVRDSLSVDHYCATLIQKVFRRFLYRSNYHFDLYRIIVVQSIFRRNAARELAVNRLSAVIAIQAAFRVFLVRASFADAWGLARREIWAATKIQSRWRGYDAQMNYLHTLADILVVQSMARVWITRRLIVPYLRSLRNQRVTSEEKRKRRTSAHRSNQRESKPSDAMNMNDRNTGDSRHRRASRPSATAHEERSRRSRQTLKTTTEEIESRSDGESGASDIIQALRASEQEHPEAWKQLSTTTSTPKRNRKGPEGVVSGSRQHVQRVRLSAQPRK